MSQNGTCNKQNSGGCSVNVGEEERQASMIGGTVLALCGLLRGSLSGLALAGIGAALIYRGHTGHCQLYAALNHSTAEQGHEDAKPQGQRRELQPQGSHQHS